MRGPRSGQDYSQYAEVTPPASTHPINHHAPRNQLWISWNLAKWLAGGQQDNLTRCCHIQVGDGAHIMFSKLFVVRCQEGMTFSGPSYRTICQADGRWSHPIPRCYGKNIFYRHVYLEYRYVSAPCVVPHVSHGFVADRASGSFIGHNQSISVQCLAQFQPTTNLSTICNNGTWSSVPKCIPAKCTELPDAPKNGMVSNRGIAHVW